MMSVSTVRGSAPICAFPGCSKTAWRDSNGTFSAYCSRTHREKAATLSIDQTLCKFCGRRCATTYRNRTPSSPLTASTINECRLINCHRPVYVDQEGTSSKYCSHRHRRYVFFAFNFTFHPQCGQQPGCTEWRSRRVFTVRVSKYGTST
ncbi:hypothetical protein BKA93DRAFT_582918 [Sparassis latifolia]